jgi:hypothetical protein
MFIVAAVILIVLFSIQAVRKEQALWRRCRKKPGRLQLQRQITLGKSHCR